MKLVISAMHRTGHHPVAIWLLHQKPNVLDFSIKTMSEWLFYVENYDELYILANNPCKIHEREDKKNFSQIITNANPELLISTHERESLSDTWYINDRTHRTCCSDYRKVVVIRDFRNWVASCIQMGIRDDKPLDEVISDKDIANYYNHLSDYGREAYYIKYNDWCVDPDYRKQITIDLGLHFTDAALNQLSIFGNGSSFDGMKHIKTAHLMNTNERYKQMLDNKDYQQILKDNDHILQLSESIFK